MVHLTDESLIVGIAAGDADAAAALVRRYQARVFGLAFTIVTDRSAAEDVAQDAFLRVWRHAAAFDVRRGSVQAWILSITRNAAIDLVRMRRQDPVDPAEVARLAAAVLGGTRGDGDPGPDQADVDLVREALRALPDDQRRAVLLAVFGGWTAKEISTAESVPLGTAKSRVRLGLEKLRLALGADR